MRKLAAYIFGIGLVLMAVGQAWPAPLATDLQFASPGTLRAKPGQALGLASEIQVATGEDLETFLGELTLMGGGGDGTDPVARQAAANAQATADAATTPAQAAQQARDVVSDWAEEGDTSSIPANKLLLAPSGTGGGLTSAQVSALIKPFARIGGTTPPTPADLAANPLSGRVLGMRTQGGVLHLNWNQLSAGSPHIVLTVEPTADQQAVGGLLPQGGVVLVRPTDNHPTQLWVRIGPQLTMVLFHTFGDPIVRPNDDGALPSAADYAGRIAVAGNQILIGVNQGGHDKLVQFRDYGPTRTEPPTRRAEELLYGGSVADPPHNTIGNFVVNTILWDRGSEVWIIKPLSSSTRWSTYSGPTGYHAGRLYQTAADAAVHVANASEVRDVYIIGHGAAQKPRMVVNFLAPTAPDWQWIPIGMSIQDVAAQVATHNTSSTAHADIRTLISTLEASSGLTIGAYSSSATYVRGSGNSIVTHAEGLFIYISSTSRSTLHDPDLYPGYWLKLNEGVTYEVITSGAHRISARTIIVDGNNDRTYLCTTTQLVPRDLAYIHAQSQSIGGSFIHLNGGLSTSAVHEEALATNTDEWPYEKVTTFREYSNVAGQDWKEGELTRYGAGNPWYIVNTDHEQGVGENPGNSDDYSRLALHSEIPTGGGGGGVSYSPITGSNNLWTMPAGASFVYIILSEDGIYYDILYPLAELPAPPSVHNIMVDSFNPGSGATDARNFIINLNYNTTTRALTLLVSSTFTQGSSAFVFRVSAF